MPKLARISSSSLFVPQNTSANATNIVAKTSYKESKIDDYYSPFRNNFDSFEISLKKKSKKKNSK